MRSRFLWLEKGIAVSGVTSEGLRITVFPAAKAGPSLLTVSVIG